jgi:putative heme degradation protein
MYQQQKEPVHMNDIPPVVHHLKSLAQEYRDTHLALQKRYQEMKSVEDFLAELKDREGMLLDRFRLVQQQLIAALEDEHLEKMLELSRIFDQMRLISLFTVQTLREPRTPGGSQEQEASVED